MNLYKKKYCINCGRNGHIMRQCLEPVISLGIITYKIEDNKIKIIMIQRRNSLFYVEFLRGRYNIADEDYIIMLINGMTYEEVEDLETKNFDTLWDDLWIINENKHYKNDYKLSKSKFNNLNIKELLSKKKYFHKTPEWGFPKGRRNYREKDLECAKREFSEETGLDISDIHIINNVIPVREDFLGDNNIRYRHVYYLAKIKDTQKNKELTIDKSNLSQYAEIGDIKWLEKEECLKKIRPTDHSKQVIINNVFNFIDKLTDNYYLKIF